MVSGARCVMIELTIELLKLPATCSETGKLINNASADIQRAQNCVYADNVSSVNGKSISVSFGVEVLSHSNALIWAWGCSSKDARGGDRCISVVQGKSCLHFRCFTLCFTRAVLTPGNRANPCKFRCVKPVGNFILQCNNFCHCIMKVRKVRASDTYIRFSRVTISLLTYLLTYLHSDRKKKLAFSTTALSFDTTLYQRIPTNISISLISPETTDRGLHVCC